MRIALVTSRATAALQDMLKVLRRYPWLRLFLYHVPVQGDGSAEKIAAALSLLDRNREQFPLDVIVLARGGGSLEDLWEFNEEVVARAIVTATVPVVTGIGHEVDTAIADLVADHHAHTPTEAAQTLVRAWNAVPEILDGASLRLRRGVRNQLADARQQLMAVERHELFRRPLDRVNQLRQLLDDRQRAMSLAVGEKLRIRQRRVNDLGQRLERQRPELLIGRIAQRLEGLQQLFASKMRGRLRVLRERLGGMAMSLGEHHPRHEIRLARGRLETIEGRLKRSMLNDLKHRGSRVAGFAAHLQALGPDNILRRGYSLTTIKKGGAVVRDAKQLRAGERIVTRLAEGSVESVVEDAAQMPLFE